ncbi:Gfo/Idh/MocA family oxidoreductase [soil metagenome]
MKRREFLSSTAAGVTGGLVTGALSSTQAAGPGIPQSAQSQGRVRGANDRIRVGSVGVGGMGRSHLNNFMQMDDVQIVTVCDVWDVNRARARRMTERQQAGAAEVEPDFRRVIDRTDLDVIVVATSDHWHAIPMVMACRSGKDVYVEKPISHTIHEGRKMVQAARQHNRIVQAGTQQRSGRHFQEAVKVVQSGVLGKVHRVATWNYGNESPAGIGRPPDGPPPSGLDWDFFLGPAPKVPFNPNRFIFTFRWFWDYAGGMMTDWGIHLLDIVLWAMKEEAPRRISAAGGNFVLDDNRETPDTIDALYEFDSFICTYSNRTGNAYQAGGNGYGIDFYGTDATLFVDRSGFEVIPETGGRTKAPTPMYLAEQEETPKPWQREWSANPARAAGMRAPSSDQNLSHIRNFLDCTRSRQRPISDIEIAHRSTAMSMLGNVAFRTGHKLVWDAAKEECVGDAEANALLWREYRAPWKL